MSDKTVKAIEEREARTRGEPVAEKSYRELQSEAKELGVPANKPREELEKSISESEGSSGSSA